jgi:hypothetical protein
LPKGHANVHEHDVARNAILKWRGIIFRFHGHRSETR